MKYQGVTIVVIGLNEADNLDNTFASIKNINYDHKKIELIYVDTGSSDKSVQIASQYVDKVFIEKSDWPTPGLARNRGIIEAKYDIIHFVDGDIQVDKDYLKLAINKIQEPDIVAVYGFLEEKSTKGINKLLLTHWEGREEGYHNATGAGGTFKKQLLIKINGYDERIKRGEEIELGERLIKSGYKIWFLNKRMGIHDYGVRTIIDLIKIYILDGYNKSHLTLLKKQASIFFRKIRIHAINNIIFNIFSILLIIILILYFKSIGILYFFFIYYFYFLLKISYYHNSKNNISINSILYSLLQYSMKPFVFYGQLYFYLRCFFIKDFCESVITSKTILE